MIKSGLVILGKYRIMEVLGYGGTSTVYLAEDLRLGKRWAIKEFQKVEGTVRLSHNLACAMREAGLMKSLDHPAFPRIVDILKENGSVYIIMDYVEGETLDQLLKRSGRFPESQVRAWALQICSALDYLHSQNPPIIYMDMKPANLILGPNGMIRIIDFGIAEEYSRGLRYTESEVFGTRGYAPPEQYSGRCDPRSDIYAFGMTLLQLLTGLEPQIVDKHVAIRSLKAEASKQFFRIIEQCIQMDPSRRYQNCHKLYHDLKHIQNAAFGNNMWDGFRKHWQYVVVIMFGVILLSGGIARGIINQEKNKNYEELISLSGAASYEDRVWNYKRAVAVDPGRPEAYMGLLEVFAEDGRFSEEENEEFISLYYQNKEVRDLSQSETVELNYKAGILYFLCYTRDDGTYSFAERILKAYSFFKENHEIFGSNQAGGVQVELFTCAQQSECYYEICNFYKTYILNLSTTEEASMEQSDKLIQTFQILMDKEKDAGEFEQLSLCYSIFILLYEQKMIWPAAGIEQDTVKALMTEVYEQAGHMNVYREQAVKMRDEILENFSYYTDAVDRAYADVYVQ